MHNIVERQAKAKVSRELNCSKMATNVFGNPVTDDIVRLVYPDVPITPKHRAIVAMKLRFEGGRALEANNFVHKLKEDFGTGTSTLCMVFNATGGDLTFDINHSWDGEVWQYLYPSIIMNGQWGAFLHVSTSSEGRSKEAVVYSGKNNDGEGRDWMLAWNTAPLNDQNRVFSETRPRGHYREGHWVYIDGLMEQRTNDGSNSWGGCKSIANVAGGSSPELVAIMTLENVDI